VRELENETRRLYALTPPGQPLRAERLSQRIAEAQPAGKRAVAGLPELPEKDLIEAALRESGGNRTHAARALGLSREGLRKKMKRHGLQ
jgi:Nif-specific regulatory protein